MRRRKKLPHTPEYMADLVRILVVQQLLARQWTYGGKPQEIKDLVVYLHALTAELSTAVHAGESVESVLSRVGDIGVCLAHMADSIQARGTTLLEMEEDAVEIAEWVRQNHPNAEERPLVAVLQVLRDHYRGETVH